MTNNARLDSIHESTATALSTLVPLDLHPDMLIPQGNVLVDDQGGPGTVIYSAGRSALRAVYASLTEIEKTHRAQLEPVLGPKGQVLRHEVPAPRRAPLADAMASKFRSAATTAARNEAAIVEALGQLETRIVAATTNPNKERASVVQAASEIRGHIKSIKDSSGRFEFIRQAIADGDPEIASAVLATSCYSSGLSKQEFELVRQLAQEKFAPREYKQRAAALAVKKALDGAQSAFLQRYAALLPSTELSKADAAMRSLKG